MSNDHQLLGISPGAGQEEVRAAYIARLKQLHPDASGTAKDAERVSELVGAYRRLRDGGTRRASAPSRQVYLRVGRPKLVPIVGRTTPAVFWGKALTLGLLGGAALSASLITYPQPVRRVSPVADAVASPAFLTDERDQPDEAIVRQAVGALQSFGPGDGAEALESHSRRCFAELATTRDIQVLDYCLAFDIAASQSYAVARQPETERTGFFNPAELKSRHANALQLLIGDRRMGLVRRSRIESETVSALANAISVNDLGQRPR